MKSILFLNNKAKAKIKSISSCPENSLKKLMAFGVLPGNKIEVLQTSPVYLIKIGHTELAIDKDIASKIMVEPIQTKKPE